MKPGLVLQPSWMAASVLYRLCLWRWMDQAAAAVQAVFYGALAFILLTIPVGIGQSAKTRVSEGIWDATRWGTYKSDFGILRYAHF